MDDQKDDLGPVRDAHRAEPTHTEEGGSSQRQEAGASRREAPSQEMPPQEMPPQEMPPQKVPPQEVPPLHEGPLWKDGSARRSPSRQEVEELADEITLLAGQIAAATARFLALLGQFDALGCWGGVGIRSLAHWLSYRAGMSLRTAREHIRVARALRELPVTARAFEAGELSFSKVRALSRVATPATEADLVAMAKASPAAHVERLVAGLRKVRRDKAAWQRRTDGAGDAPAQAGGGAHCGGLPEAGDADPGSDPGSEPGSEPGFEPGPASGPGPDPNPGPGSDLSPGPQPGPASGQAPEDPPPLTLQWRWDEDTGHLVVWGRFGPADGRVVLAALTRAELERVRTLAHEDAEPDADREADPCAAVDRTAPPPVDAGPALVALASLGLSVQEAPTLAPAAEVIYLHQAASRGSAEHPPSASASLQQGVVSADDGPSLEQAAGEEVMCGADARCVLKGARGAVLKYGRRRRRFSTAQTKALRLRDRACRTPGCQRTRFLHAHHVVYWWEGGPTDLDNAILLCSSCHRAVHLGRLTIRALGAQDFVFIDTSSGKVMPDAPPLFGRADHIVSDRTITPQTITGSWWGEPLDLSLVTATLLAQWRLHSTRLRRPGDDPTPPWDNPGTPAWDSPDAPRWDSAA